MFKSTLIITGFFLLGTIPVLAQDCSNAISQPELNKCAQAEYASADKKLNTIYNSYRNLLDDKGKKSLLAMQKQWINFRDLACKHEAAYFEGGTVQPMVFASCMRNLTEAQTKLIQDWLEREKL